MAEIKINALGIDSAITTLQDLKGECNAMDVTPPSTVGGGKTVNELEEIAAVYKSMHSDFSTLVSNTISFLQNVRDSFASSDQKAGTGMGGRGVAGSGVAVSAGGGGGNRGR